MSGMSKMDDLADSMKDEFKHKSSAVGTVTIVNGSLNGREKSSPAVVDEPATTIWESMMKGYYKEKDEIDAFRKTKKIEEPDYTLPAGSVAEYMETRVFSVLCPALINMLLEAVRTEALDKTQTTFDPLDKIAEYMWNNNPKYPKRVEDKLQIHHMPWAKKLLKEHPRPHFPKSWIYTPDTASKAIQAFFRGYLVRRRADVQEMRQFWKIIKEEAAEKELGK